MNALGLLTTFGASKPTGGPSGPPTPLIASLSGLGSYITGEQVGWRFTVGAASLTARGARVRTFTSLNEERVRIWRVSDETQIATLLVTPSATDTWTAADFSTPVTLASGAAYIVTMRTASPVSRSLRYATGRTLDSRITWGEGRFKNGDGFPNTTTSETLGLVDLLVDP